MTIFSSKYHITLSSFKISLEDNCVRQMFQTSNNHDGISAHESGITFRQLSLLKT